MYHGVFTAEGSLKFPVFNEAAQRGEQQTVDAQLQQLRDQEDNLRGTIEAQIRTSMLDIDTASQLVRVAQSNVDLAHQELADSRERFSAGVSDNLEVVDAEATVTGAQAQLVSALYQFKRRQGGSGPQHGRTGVTLPAPSSVCSYFPGLLFELKPLSFPSERSERPAFSTRNFDPDSFGSVSRLARTGINPGACASGLGRLRRCARKLVAPRCLLPHRPSAISGCTR